MEYVFPFERIFKIFILGANDAPYTTVDLMNVNGGMFLITCATSFPHLFAIILIFPKMKIVFRREYHSGLYSLGAAYLATVFAGIPVILLLPLIFGKFKA